MQIVKVISSLLIIISSTLLGIQKAKKLSDREYILREFITFLSSVENEIKYMLTVLPNAYEIARMPLQTKLKSAIGNITQDMLLDGRPIIIEHSINNNISQITELTVYDRTIISSTLKNLGMTNVEGQISVIQNSIKTIENQIQEAIYIKNKSSKMYRTIGMLSGIILVVIFI